LEKTAIVQIGNTVPISDEIRDLGFTFSDRIRILGMDLSNDPADWDQNFTAILDTMRKKLSFGNDLIFPSLAGLTSQSRF
jgi:hypothetical protein